MKIPSFSLRTKIILSFLLVIILGGLLSLVVGSRLIKNTLISQAQEKVRHDLSAAWMVYNEKLNDIKEIVSLTADRESLHDYLKNQRYDILQKYLNRVREDWGLDILTLTDHTGEVLVRTRNPQIAGDDQSQDEIVCWALKMGVLAHTQIVSREELIKEGEDLAEKAYVKFIPTPKAVERPENEETSGMMLKAAASVVDENNNLLGALYGGILLSRDYMIVDRIKEIVYKGAQYKGVETGTATIFQHDLRVSTNVPTTEGGRAIGTRVSKEVHDVVLIEGKPWIHRAFVVNDWYITAYEPIKNVNDEIIGILYVGMLEQPYLDTANRVMASFVLIAVLMVFLLLIILYFSTDRIIKPLHRMMEATEKISQGNLSHKVEVTSSDEIGYLADSFNKMTTDLETANAKLLDWGKTLEKKVEERTQELTRMQAHLIQSEKLASIGKLAAGVAHEINNPLGGVLIYSHLLLEDTEKDSLHYENLKKIVKETSRCKDIVRGLLDFARPKDPEMSQIDINEIVKKSLYIVEGQSLFQNIRIQKNYSSDLPRIVGDSAQLQQVFMNIILNAAEAMDGDGTISITTSHDSGGKYIDVLFQDTGHGIQDEDLKRLFEPFFTTKEVGKGTGLGLAISYSIIQKHQGTIEASSQMGQGTTFAVRLPAKQKSDEF